jgi:endonuclease/exonuclease/phosphatase (EEP) superfamily protein YafD
LLPVSRLYGGGLAAWSLARLTPVASWWPFELLDVFAAWLYLPLPVLAALVGLRRDRRAAAWLGVATLAFGWEFGPLFLPAPRSTPEGGAPLRVMTVNLLGDNTRYAEVAAALSEQQPDVIAVQELSPEMARRLRDLLLARYPHQALYPRLSSPGIGLFSRYPIRAATAPERGEGTCACQASTLDLAGRAVTVLNVHPPRPSLIAGRLGRLPLPAGFETARQGRSLRALLGKVQAATGPLLVVGDLNTSDRQPNYRRLSGSLRDSHREAGWGFGYTFPSPGVGPMHVPVLGHVPAVPLVRIDYVWHNDRWATRAAWTAYVPGSDHRGVVADLVLR